jgi:hypothetical protein
MPEKMCVFPIIHSGRGVYPATVKVILVPAKDKDKEMKAEAIFKKWLAKQTEDTLGELLDDYSYNYDVWRGQEKPTDGFSVGEELEIVGGTDV